MNPANDLLNHLLRLGDSALVQGQRLCEWCGRAPALEEELALMNVGLDLVGQARNWLDYAAELLADGRDADHLAFRRDERAYRNLLLVEQPNGDFAVTMLKQFFYDAWHLETLRGLCLSSDPRIAGVAAKAFKEVTYHLRRSSEWVERLGDGTEESHRRMLQALPRLWRLPGTDRHRSCGERVAPGRAAGRPGSGRHRLAGQGRRGVRPGHPACARSAQPLLPGCAQRPAYRTPGPAAGPDAITAASLSRCGLVS